MTTYTAYTLTTPDGPFTVVEDATGAVHAAGWHTDPAGLAERAGIAAGEIEQVPVEAVLPIGATPQEPGPARSDHPAARAVAAYYAGTPAAVREVPVVQHGTELQEAVWQALRDIPAGETRTYSELATTIGRPQAFRAVAAACGRNANALFVPCHRVLAASGALSGFAWGTEVKAALLTREGSR